MTHVHVAAFRATATQPRPVTIFVQGIPPTPNATRRQHWHQRSDEANVWKDAVVIGLHQATGGRWARVDHCELEVVLVVSTNHRRDPDNLVAAAKPLIDGLVTAGLLADDSFACIERLTVSRERGPVTGIRLTVRPTTTANTQPDATEASR